MNEEILTEVTEDMTESIADEKPEAAPAELPEDVKEEAKAPESAPEEPKKTEEVTQSYGIEELKAELDELRRELRERRSAFERMSKEIEEFSELFPSEPLSSLPDSVWESVRGGVPLAASFALYEKRQALLRADAERANEQNRSSSTGSVGRSAVETFFSPSDVREMSREEVRNNYSTILESMKKWN